ncbi:MAG: hypothetical protein FJX11_21965 [Alphaproteobacteria bacterium]|nr:hypothetical protein [Alphaproteobacteria bacterium]
MTRKTVVATAAALFAAGIVTAAHGQATGGVKCAGVNSCKGTSSCKTASSACKGQNSCKGQGFVNTGSSIECTAIRSK